MCVSDWKLTLWNIIKNPVAILDLRLEWHTWNCTKRKYKEVRGFHFLIWKKKVQTFYFRCNRDLARPGLFELEDWFIWRVIACKTSHDWGGGGERNWFQNCFLSCQYLGSYRISIFWWGPSIICFAVWGVGLFDLNDHWFGCDPGILKTKIAG